MSVVEKIALGLTLLFLVVVCLRLFAAPLKLALKVAFNSALGFGALWLLNLTTSVTGLSLGLSWFNAIVIGILGVPGFGLLLLVQWVLAWLALSVAFSYYVEKVAHYTELYGSIATIVVVLLWLYMTGQVLIMGAEYNGSRLAYRENKTIHPPEGEKGTK